jgi:hypothetical protein
LRVIRPLEARIVVHVTAQMRPADGYDLQVAGNQMAAFEYKLRTGIEGSFCKLGCCFYLTVIMEGASKLTGQEQILQAFLS